jgi:glycerate 2-kinase
MKMIVAPDSFKESLTAKKAADAMAEGIYRVFPNAECIIIPMADGGEGTVQSLVEATDGVIITVEVTGPVGEKVNAEYGILGNRSTAVIEMASGAEILYEYGMTAIFGISREITSIEEALEKGYSNLMKAVETVCRLIKHNKMS